MIGVPCHREQPRAVFFSLPQPGPFEPVFPARPQPWTWLLVGREHWTRLLGVEVKEAEEEEEEEEDGGTRLT